VELESTLLINWHVLAVSWFCLHAARTNWRKSAKTVSVRVHFDQFCQSLTLFSQKFVASSVHTISPFSASTLLAEREGRPDCKQISCFSIPRRFCSGYLWGPRLNWSNLRKKPVVSLSKFLFTDFACVLL